MAGISNPAYRQLARRFGAGIVYSEMISSNGLVFGSTKTFDMLRFDPGERPIGIQLFGANPEIMHKAARIVSDYNPDLIDLNFGCPVKKVVNKNGGAAVLKDLGLTEELVAAAVSGSKQPVTVKLRSGWDELSKVFVEAGKAAEKAGAAAITLHARTRSSHFSGNACWDEIKRLKEAVGVPVIGNGDITCGEDAAHMFEQTGCDAVMIGRAALGCPWIFRQINDYLSTGKSVAPPTLKEIVDIMLEHTKILIGYSGEKNAIMKMRGVVGFYTRGWYKGSELRRIIVKTSTFDELQSALNKYLAERPAEDCHASEPA